MDPLSVECDLQSLRRLYVLLLQSNANNESLPQTFLLDENSQILLKRLLDSATNELLARQSKVLAQAQLGLPEKVSKNSVSTGIIKTPSKAGLTEQVLDSIQLIETQLSAFRFCSSRVVSRDDRTRSCSKSPSTVVTPMEGDYLSSALMERRQSYLRSNYMPASRQMSQTTRTSNIAPRLQEPHSRYDPTLALQSQGSSSRDDNQIVLVRSRPPLPPRPLRSVGFKKPRQSNKTTSMKPTLLDETWDEDSIEEESGNSRSGTRSESVEQVTSTEQESEEASGETISTSGSSWETHTESVTESDSSYPSESDDDENSQVSDSPPHKRKDRSREPAKQRKKVTGRLKRFKEKLGKVFHHHHHHHHHHHQNKEEDRKVSGWKHLVKKHLQKDKEKLAERRWKSESKGLTTHKNKGGQFHALVKGFMRHHRRHSKKQKQKLQSHGRKMNWKRQGGVKFPNGGGRVKLGQTNYLCNKDHENQEN